jgi:ABC-type sugar transport system, periplasmic component
MMCTRMRKTIKTVFAAALVFLLPFLTACTSAETRIFSEIDPDSTVEITMWVYPVGDFSDPSTMNKFISAFNKKNPDIKVNVDYLDYETGDDQISEAIKAQSTPDIVMEGPERIVANWSEAGLMADVSSLWTDDSSADIIKTNKVISDACIGTDGRYYEYPLCMTAHCMAINYEIFKKAGALKYIDRKTRTWSTDDFIKACRAVALSGLVETPGIIYCGGQGGDQGTRALVTNLYGAEFTNKNHTEYTINSSRGIKALSVLSAMTKKGYIKSDSNIEAAGELQKFTSGDIAMSFAWNASNEKNYASNVDFTPYVMAFPTDSGRPQLCGGIWGFGIFDNGNHRKAEAARKFISFLCDDKDQSAKSVRATGLFAVRHSLGNVYDGTSAEKRMNSYKIVMQYLGDYYSITPGWTAQRTAWWNMLQQVFNGTDPKTAADNYAKTVNKNIKVK